MEADTLIVPEAVFDAFYGYDSRQVDAYVADVDALIDELDRRLEAAHERIAELHDQLGVMGDVEAAVGRTLMTAEKAAEQRLALAESQAGTIVTDAEDHARRLTEAARRRAAAILAEARLQARAQRVDLERVEETLAEPLAATPLVSQARVAQARETHPARVRLSHPTIAAPQAGDSFAFDLDGVVDVVEDEPTDVNPVVTFDPQVIPIGTARRRGPLSDPAYLAGIRASLAGSR